MTNRLRACTLALSPLLLIAPACDDSKDEAKPQLADSSQDMYGGSIEHWDSTWWQWAMNIPAASSPLAGGDCTQDQKGEVWFLAGNSGGVERRTCTIPEGKALFFPLVNASCHSCPEVYGAENECPLASESGILDCMGGFGEVEVDLHLSIDGYDFEDLDQHWADPNAWQAQYDGEGPSRWFFDVGEGSDGLPTEPVECLDPWEDGNECMAPAGPRWFSSAGYYAMVEPLPVGDHEIEFGGRLGPADSPYFELSLTYEITIEPAS